MYYYTDNLNMAKFISSPHQKLFKKKKLHSYITAQQSTQKNRLFITR